MEKIISCKSGKVITKEDNEWVELVDQDDKIHRVFKGIKLNDGEWRDLSGRIDMLKGYIEAGTIEGKAFKLIKEQKGKYWNCIDIEEIKDVFQQEAIKQTQDAEAQMRPRSYALAYAKDLAVADRIKTSDILTYADWFSAWLTVGFKVEKPSEGQSPITPQPTIDMDALKAQVTDLLKAKKITSSHLKEKYGISKLNDIADLSDELKQEFVKEIEGKLKEV